MSNATYPNPGVKWGLIAGAVAVVAGITFYYTDVPTLFSLKYGVIQLFTFALLGLVAGIERKRLMGGAIDFKSALQPIFTTFVIAALISNIFTYILANVIDPTIPEQIRAATIKSFKEMESFQRAIGTPRKEYEDALTELQTRDFRLSPQAALMSYLTSLILYFAISALLALGIRKRQTV